MGEKIPKNKKEIEKIILCQTGTDPKVIQKIILSQTGYTFDITQHANLNIQPSSPHLLLPTRPDISLENNDQRVHSVFSRFSNLFRRQGDA